MKHTLFKILADLIYRRGEPIDDILNEYDLDDDLIDEFLEWYENYLSTPITFLGE